VTAGLYWCMGRGWRWRRAIDWH